MKMNCILDYLADLEKNNSRDWYHENKGRYQEANRAFEELVQGLILDLGREEPALLTLKPGDLTFRLTRDTRFSHDKSPYNPAFRAHISSMGKLPVPVGAFLFLRPGDRSFLGGGLFSDMFKDATAMVRDAIAARGEEWEAVVSAPQFRELFTVGGSALKKVPQGYDPGHPQAEYLKNKSWYLEYPVSDERLLAPDFLPWAADVFRKMRPFNAFLNRALEEFRMPQR